MMTDKELILALRGTQSRSKRALLDEAAERILSYAVDFSCPIPDLYQAKCGGVPEAHSECRDRPTKSQFKRMAAQMDYAPVVHGQWIATHDDFYSCSLCMYPIAVWAQKKYCPYCGAKMDGTDGE